jgi:hypothetical protein
MSEPHLFLATPCYGGLTHHLYTTSVIGLTAAAARFGVGLSATLTAGEALVTRARNLLAARFLESTCTHMLAVDADQGFDPLDVFRMLRFDGDLVCAISPGKTTYWDQVAAAAARGVTDSDELRQAGATFVVNFATELEAGQCTVTVDQREFGRFAEIEEGGTGLMLIKRTVFEQMIERYGAEMEHVVDYPPAEVGTKRYAFFDTRICPTTKRYLSEDYEFCRRWRAMGGKIHAAVDVKLTHSGTGTWVGDPSRLLATPAPPVTVQAQPPAVATPAPARPMNRAERRAQAARGTP